jgi:phosphoribosylaminoimidazolecarboxamide formyltransferase/IMP cyclohydrolase
MNDSPIQRALISVSDKTGLLPFARFLHARGVTILSTGGTAKALREAGIAVTEVADVTKFPEMLDGRVKTLHPLIHGGLLGKRAEAAHARDMATHGIEPIDLLVVSLYPFEETVAKGASFEACVEQIDIGGPAMLRAGAKNHASVTVLTDPQDYALAQREIEAYGNTLPETRRKLAAKIFRSTAAYDTAISRWFGGVAGEERFPERLTFGGQLRQTLRYGENPHQKAAFYQMHDVAHGIASARQIQGKELSYNNINDTDAALALVCEFASPAIAIIKHANPCGVAVGATLAQAYVKALACDPVSAYGGIIAANRPLDASLVEAIGTLFAEVIIAPGADEAARALLAQKKNLRLLVTEGLPHPREALAFRSVSGGFLVQEEDHAGITRDQMTIHSRRQPSEAEMDDMLFAFTVAKHVKSNAIVLARDGATIGIGAGQMSRVDSVRLACQKAEAAGIAAEGAALASDAFFPFDDNVHQAAKAGVRALIQPGGSIRDEEVVKAADQYDMAMAFTGVRHFRH